MTELDIKTLSHAVGEWWVVSFIFRPKISYGHTDFLLETKHSTFTASVLVFFRWWGMWMTSSWWGSLSCRRVIGLQLVGGTPAPTNHAHSQENKTHYLTEGQKRHCALSILRSLTLLLAKPAVICSWKHGPVSPSGRGIQAAPAVCKLEVGHCNPRWQL